MKAKFGLFLISLTFLFAGCDATKSEKSTSEKTIDRSEITAAWAELFDNRIAEIKTSAENLETSFSIFGKEQSSEKLQKVQQDWKALAVAIQESSFINVGPIKTKYGFLPINYWPINQVKIEEVLESEITLDTKFMGSASNSIKGIWALEHLLFDPNKTIDEMLKAYDGERGEQRIAFVKAQIQYIQERTEVLSKLWSDYRSVFSENKGSGTNEPFSLIINRITSQLEAIKNESLGKPMGISLGGEPAPSLTRGYQSESALLMIKSELASAKQLFNASTNSTSLAQLTDAMGDEKLSQKINTSFDKAIQLSEQFDIPLSAAVVEQPQQVEKLYEEVQNLVVLFKSDLSSRLSVTITFNDMDGD